MASATLTPRVRIMAICDGIRESRVESGVFNLKGVRQEIAADTSAFPFIPGRLRLFLLLSSARAGEFTCYVRVVNDRSDRTVFHSYLQPRPLFEQAGGWLAYRVPMRCGFVEAGRYSVQVWFFQQNGPDVLKGEMPFTVTA